MKYNFDEIIDRRGTMATKVEKMPEGSAKDALPLWVADMDFPCAEPILKALHERIDRKIFGYTLYNTDECMNAVLGWFKKRYGWEEKAENLFFCPGNRIRVRGIGKPSDEGGRRDRSSASCLLSVYDQGGEEWPRDRGQSADL